MSENKFWISLWAMIFSAVLGMAIVVGAFTHTPPNVTLQKHILDARVKIECIHAHGDWKHVNDSDDPVAYACTFK